MLPGQVALLTNMMQSRPEGTTEQANIVVGTPKAVESGLSKVNPSPLSAMECLTSCAQVRGKVGGELRGKADWATIVGGFKFSYVVFDEVHCLDGDEVRPHKIPGVSNNTLTHLSSRVTLFNV